MPIEPWRSASTKLLEPVATDFVQILSKNVLGSKALERKVGVLAERCPQGCSAGEYGTCFASLSTHVERGDRVLANDRRSKGLKRGRSIGSRSFSRSARGRGSGLASRLALGAQLLVVHVAGG